MKITPKYHEQKGLFYRIKQLKGSQLYNFVKVVGHPNDCNYSTNSIIDDIYEIRYLSALNESDIEISFPSFPLKITHVAIKALKGYFYTKSFNVYNSFNNELIGSISLTEACVTSPGCNSTVIVVNKTISNPIVSSLKFELSERSDKHSNAEFKSIELYGELLTECYETRARMKNHNILLCILIISS